MQKIGISFILILFLQGVNAQTVVIDRKGESSKKEADQESGELKGFDVQQAIKFTPTQLIVGEINFSYEKAIGQRSSFEIEAGPTLSRVGIFRLDFNDNNSGALTRKSDLGGFVGLGFRFYPLMKRYNMNGLYISPMFKYRHYNTAISDSAGVLANTKDTRTNFSFTFNVGYQLWASQYLTFDFYAGCGLNYTTTKENSISYFYDGNTNLYTSQWDVKRDQGVLFVARLGIKIGIGF